MLIPIDRPLIDGRNVRGAATQTVSAGFVATHNQLPVLLLTCDSADQTSGAPHIQAGVKAGQELLIIVTDDANRVTITSSVADGGLTKLNGDWAVAEGAGIGAKIWLVWDGTYWWEVDRKNGELTASGLVAHAQNRATTASGNYSHVEGSSSAATNTSAHAEGQATDAIGTVSHAEGNVTLASGANSHAQGERSIAALHGEHAQASGRFANNGDAQFSRVIFRSVPGGTTGPLLTEIFLNGVDDLLTILDEYTYACNITVVGRQDTGGDHFMGTYRVLIERTGGTVAIVGAVDSYENNPGGLGGSGLPVVILAGTTNLEIWVQGLPSCTIRWVATVEMTRVGFAN